jgi:hypothetical protein
VLKLSDIFRSYGKTYLNKYSGNILPSHKKAIIDISLCRTPAMGGRVYQCKKCSRYHYSYHSCGNRNCNNCQNDKADEWLQNNNNLLLPVNYFMITFTLPEDLRHAARGNQKLFYNLLFKCSAESIESFSSNSKFIGGKTGYLGVLHTWSRKLDYHPHVHYIVTGGGLSIKEDKWIDSGSKFLFPVRALSVVFKAKFRDELRKLNPVVFSQIPPGAWKRKWVINSIAVGNGFHAMKYLAQYVFRVAIGNNRILKHQDGFVTFKFKNSKTKIWKVMKLNTEEFIRRFLQHVLPPGFVKVRYFGLFASKNRSLLNIVNKLLGHPMTKKKNKKSSKNKPNVICCPNCGQQMKLIIATPRGRHYNKAPPLDIYFAINQTELLAVN